LQEFRGEHHDGGVMAESTRPYPPSWFDRVSDAIRRGPIPSAVVYLLLVLVIAVAREIVGWTDGSVAVGTIYPYFFIDAFNPVFLFFATHLLDDQARRAFVSYQPVLSPGTDSDSLLYRLTTLPARSTLIVSLLAMPVGVAYIPLALSPATIADSLYFTSPQAVVADSTISVLQTIATVLFVWHTLHQLFWISRIYSRHTDVSIFHIGPLYSLSRVTAMTAVTLLVFSYLFAGWVFDSLGSALVVGGILVVAALAFVVPLYGAHQLLVAEKSRQHSEVARRIEATGQRLHAEIDADDYTRADSLQSALSGLETERAIIGKAPTWPWDPEAVRIVLTALLVPIVLWVITRILERFVI
jgi:hypothetical protein